MESHKKEIGIYGALCIVIALFTLFLLGAPAFRVVLGFFLFTLPFYLILLRLKLPLIESLAFSFASSLALFPSLVYGLGFIVPFRMGIILSFLLFLIVPLGFLLKDHLKKTSRE